MDEYIAKAEALDYTIKSVTCTGSLFDKRRYEVRVYYVVFDQIRMRTLLIDAENSRELKGKIVQAKADILNEITGKRP